MFIFERKREREWQSVSNEGKAERGSQRIWSRLQALSCQHRAQCRARTHELWDHDLSQSQILNWLSHSGTPSLFFFNVYFWEREREWAGAEREGDTKSKIGSRLQVVSTEPNAGLELMNCEIMNQAEVRHLTNWATQAPLHYFALNHI